MTICVCVCVCVMSLDVYSPIASTVWRCGYQNTHHPVTIPGLACEGGVMNTLPGCELGTLHTLWNARNVMAIQHTVKLTILVPLPSAPLVSATQRQLFWVRVRVRGSRYAPVVLTGLCSGDVRPPEMNVAVTSSLLPVEVTSASVLTPGVSLVSSVAVLCIAENSVVLLASWKSARG